MRTRRDDVETANRWVQWILVLALATVALATVGNEPASAAPAESISRDQLRSDCQLAGGVFWETASGYGCSLGGLVVECDAAGNCLSWCYEAQGCRCDIHGDGVICVHAFTPDESSDPWDDIAQMDPYQEAKLPDRTETPPSDPVIAPDTVIIGGDQVAKGAD